MQLDTTIRSPGALALGLFFAGVTACTIFDDVWNGAPFTIGHMNALAALVAAVASGHFIMPAARQGLYGAALGLALIFAGATAYVVTSSGARNAEVANSKAAAILKANEERASIRAKLAEAETDVDAAKADHDEAKRLAAKECATGKAKRCDGRIETRDAAAKDLERAESHAALMRGKLAYLGPETVPFAGYKRAATFFEAVNMGEAAKIEARLIIIMPFASVLITELSVIVFLAVALGRREPKPDTEPDSQPTAPECPARQADLETVSDFEAVEMRALISPAGRSGKPRGGSRLPPKSGSGLSKGDALDDLMRRLADGQTIPSQAALADDWGRPETTVSDWMKEWRRLGIIPPAVQAGRCKATVAEGSFGVSSTTRCQLDLKPRQIQLST